LDMGYWISIYVEAASHSVGPPYVNSKDFLRNEAVFSGCWTVLDLDFMRLPLCDESVFPRHAVHVGGEATRNLRISPWTPQNARLQIAMSLPDVHMKGCRGCGRHTPTHERFFGNVGAKDPCFRSWRDRLGVTPRPSVVGSWSTL